VEHGAERVGLPDWRRDCVGWAAPGVCTLSPWDCVGWVAPGSCARPSSAAREDSANHLSGVNRRVEPLLGLSFPTHHHFSQASTAARTHPNLLLVLASALPLPPPGLVFVSLHTETMAGNGVFPTTRMPSEADRDNKACMRAAAASQGIQARSPGTLSTGYPPYSFGTASYYPPAPNSDVPSTDASVPSTSQSLPPTRSMEQAPLLRTEPSMVFQQGQTNMPPTALAAPTVRSPFTLGMEPVIHSLNDGLDVGEPTNTQTSCAKPIAQLGAVKSAGSAGNTTAFMGPVNRLASGGPARPRPRYGRSKHVVAPSLSSVPGLHAAASRASAPLRESVMGASEKAAATRAAVAHVSGSASGLHSTAHKSASKGAKASPGAALKKSQASAKAAKVARAKALQAKIVSTDSGTAADKSMSAAAEGLLSLSCDGSKLEDTVKKTMENQEKTIQTLAKAVGKLQMERNKEAASTSSMLLATGRVEHMAPGFGGMVHGGPSYKRRKTACEAVETLSSHVASQDKEPSPCLPVQELCIPPQHSSKKLTFSSATAAAKTIAMATAIAQKRADGSIIMVAIRDELTPKIKAIMGNAQTTMDVLPSPNIRQSIINSTAMAVMKTGEKTVEAFLLENVHSPSKKRKCLLSDSEDEHAPHRKVKTVGVHTTLMQVFHHVLGNFKRNVVAGWFKEAAKKAPKDMTVEEAEYWCSDGHFFVEPLGRKGIIAGVAKGFKYLGAPHRIHHPVGPGGEIVVDMCHGHFSLASLFVSEVLTSIRDSLPDKTTIDATRYKNYVAQVVRHDLVLPKHSDADRGIILVDGKDPRRAVFEKEFMPSAMVEADKAPPAGAVVDGAGTGAVADGVGTGAVPNGVGAGTADIAVGGGAEPNGVGPGAAANEVVSGMAVGGVVAGVAENVAVDVAPHHQTEDVVRNGATADAAGNRAEAGVVPTEEAAFAAAGPVNAAGPLLPVAQALARPAAIHGRMAWAARQEQAAAILAAAQAQAAALLNVHDDDRE